MSAVAIYLEGGGSGRDSRAALRRGMDALLDPLTRTARARSWRWKLVCCGRRHEAFGAFMRSLRAGESTVTALLVDAEGPVAASATLHLQSPDGWDLHGVPDDSVHLMIQTMESWIIADQVALAAWSGPRFNTSALPRATDLENVSRTVVIAALERATRHTPKGVYHKIRHASDLLQRVDPDTLQKRCPACKRLFETLHRLIMTG